MGLTQKDITEISKTLDTSKVNASKSSPNVAKLRLKAVSFKTPKSVKLKMPSIPKMKMTRIRTTL